MTESGGGRILVVDDDEGIRGALADLLADKGHDVSLAANGKEALELCHSRPAPDLRHRRRWRPAPVKSHYRVTGERSSRAESGAIRRDLSRRKASGRTIGTWRQLGWNVVRISYTVTEDDTHTLPLHAACSCRRTTLHRPSPEKRSEGR